MKTYTLHYTPEALDDLRDIFSYIAYHLQEKRTAHDQLSRIKAEIKKLKSMPEQCQSVAWEPWHSRITEFTRANKNGHLPDHNKTQAGSHW